MQRRERFLLKEVRGGEGNTFKLFLQECKEVFIHGGTILTQELGANDTVEEDFLTAELIEMLMGTGKRRRGFEFLKIKGVCCKPWIGRTQSYHLS